MKHLILILTLVSLSFLSFALSTENNDSDSKKFEKEVVTIKSNPDFYNLLDEPCTIIVAGTSRKGSIIFGRGTHKGGDCDIATKRAYRDLARNIRKANRKER